MARLAGSPVPVPTTFRSTSGARALKPGPSTVRCTSTTLTSAPMATFSRVAADAGTARTSSSITSLTSMTESSSPLMILVHLHAVARNGHPHRSFADRLRAVGHQQRIAHTHVVAVERAEEQSLLDVSGQPAPVGPRRRRPQGDVRRAQDDDDRAAGGAVVGEALPGHMQEARLGAPLEPGAHAQEVG